MSYNIPINQIRQFLFCPRIPYFEFLLGYKKEKPLWVKQGKEKHQKIKILFKKRNMTKFHLQESLTNKHFSLFVESLQHCIYGKVDCVLETENYIYPVEFKTSSYKPKLSQILQLLAYGICAEKNFNKKFLKGFIVLLDKEKIYPFQNSLQNQNKLLETLQNMQNILKSQLMPYSSASIEKCYQCEYLNRCNDREIYH